MELSYKNRILIYLTLIGVLFSLVWIRIIDLQIIKSQEIIKEVKKQFYKRPIFLRGDIRDRNGNLLVLDVLTYELYNKANNIKVIPEEKITKLISLLKINSGDLKKKLNQKINTKICSGINEATARKIKQQDFDFVYTYPVVTRKYPHKKMAAHILGFVNSDHKGQHGVEYFHENLITKLPENNSKSIPFPKGTDIVLTIDSALQEYAEEELKKALAKAKAVRGSIIVLSCKSGEIYAWAVYPNYDPNNYFKERSIKNWSITDIYEPGSTFKIITVSSALENMIIGPSSTFYDPGFLKVGKRTIRNHHKTKPQQISLLELFKQSSNIASAQIGLLMEPEIFYNSIKNFMLGQKTNIDLPGESEGLLLNHKKWKTIDQATTAFGQGAVSVTPLQLASAIASIGNHGLWVQPHVLKGIWDENYKIISKSPYTIISQEVISQETADFVSGLLKKSVRDNLKAMVYIPGDVPGYEVAGKTGTAQKVKEGQKGYLSGHTIASFIGYFPADDPEILTLVVIDDPRTGGGWGNTVCGPVFNNVARLAAKRILKNT